jgi:putative transposase
MNIHPTDQTGKILPRASRNLCKNKYRISSNRLQRWDYSNPGYYFVTICTKNKQYVFGEIVPSDDDLGARINLSQSGSLVEKIWKSIPVWYQNVSLDCMQIMPDHVHCVLVVEEKKKAVTLGLVMNQFKGECTKAIRKMGNSSFEWQSRFHDHVIRNENDLERIRKYIFDNPVRWLAGEDKDW